jgi:hypothetical protein
VIAPTTELKPRPTAIQRAILEAEREAHENSIFQAEFRIKAQQRLKAVLGNEVAEPIKQLTKVVEESMVVIALIEEELAKLPEEPAKAA